jgi:very-short-patch-repair endonuclease
MDYPAVQELGSGVWMLAERQHGVVARTQLLELGLHPQAIKHRIQRGRLHPLWREVYAVGRPHVTRYGRWMAAVLTCGPEAVLSDFDAGALFCIRPKSSGAIHVSIPARRRVRDRPGIRVHRRVQLAGDDVTRHHGIPVTSPVRTLIDLSTQLSPNQVERAVGEADKLGLVDLEALRGVLDGRPAQRGVRTLRKLLDRRTFVLTDTELEQRFLPIVRRAGLPKPHTRFRVNGFKVDFYWPELGLVVETDGLRYHRTPAQQATDRVRDQAHAAAGLTPLRFTHAQVAYEAHHVEGTLRAVARRLGEHSV